MESTVYQEIKAEGRLEGRRDVLANQLRYRLGKSKKVEALVNRLALSTEGALEKIQIVLVESKKKDLLAALERLVPKAPK